MKKLFLILLAGGLTLTAHAAEKIAEPSSGTNITSEAKENPAPAEKTAVRAQTAEDEGKSQPPVSLVAPLQDLITYHNNEIASLKRLISRWDKKVSATAHRQQELEEDVKSKSQRAQELSNETSKSAKRESARLGKEISRINKDIAAIQRELTGLTKELSKELKDVSRESQQALLDAYEEARLKISQPKK